MQKLLLSIGIALCVLDTAQLNAISLDTWRVRNTNNNNSSTANLLGVCSGQGLFVSVGEQGTILTSPDGSNWTKRISGTGTRLRSITYASGRFIVVGGDAAPNTSRIVLGSTNGIDWSTLGQSSEVSLVGVAYAKGLLAAVASGFSGDLLTSTNGSNWTVRATVSGVMSEVVFATNVFVAVGNTIQSSPDGMTWTKRLDAVQSLRGVTYGRGKFVAVGDGTPSLFATSTDGINWGTYTNPATGNLKCVRYGNGYYVAMGGAGAIASSSDALAWTNRASGSSGFLRGACHAAAAFVAVADGGVILQSGLTAPQLLSAPNNLPGYFQVMINADPGRSYFLEATTDFVNWSRIFPFTPTSQLTPVAVSVEGYPRRLFRVVMP